MPTPKSSHVLDDSSVQLSNAGVSNTLVLVTVCISILLNVIAIYVLIGNSIGLTALNDPLGIKRSILEVEYAKVGGKANYELLLQAQLIQFKTNLPQLKQFIASQGGKTPTTTTINTPQRDINFIPATNIQASLKDGAVIEWNPEAKITVTEYSDMECPFCLKQYHETQLKEKLLAQYGSGVNFVFKNSRWVNHPGTEAKGIGALCAEKVWGPVAYVQFYTTVMWMSTAGESVFPVSRLPELAEKIGLDKQKWQSCFDGQETMQKFLDETKEAAGFNLKGTPGTLIKNNKTGKTATIEGAYPYEAFTEKIDSLSK